MSDSTNYFEQKQPTLIAQLGPEKEVVYTNKSFTEVQAIIEPFRIANPNMGAGIRTPEGNSWVGLVTWADQMEMFWEYPTYTPEGDRLASLRKAEQDAKGILVSWE